MADFVPRAFTALDDPRLKLYGQPIGDSKSKPTFHAYYTNNIVRIDVWPNTGSDSDKAIRGNVDVPSFLTFIKRLQKIIDDPTPDVSFTMENSDTLWNKAINKRDTEPTLLTKLAYGRDKEGRVWVSLLSSDSRANKIIFYFGVTLYHKLSRRGIPLTDAEISAEFAAGWTEVYTSLLPAVAATGYEHKTKAKPAGDGGGGNYRSNNNNQRSGSGGGDDDLPF